MRVGRRAVLRAVRSAGLRAGTRAALRAGRRASGVPQDAPIARQKTRRLCAARRAGCAQEDAPFARRARARARSFFFCGGGRRLEFFVRRGRGWLTAPPSQAVKGEHLSQSQGARILPYFRASCSSRLSMEMYSSFAERDAEEANEEAENAGRGRTQSS